MTAYVVNDLPPLAAREAVSTPVRPQPPTAVSLACLRRPDPGGVDELLRHRFLCRGGGLLLVGPTGIGKSSLSMQAMICWALGRPAFGVEPTRPLKSLLIQAENDDGDLAEMRDGVVRGLELTEEEKTQAFSKILLARENCRSGAEFFALTARPLLEEHRPDLVWIDPALAFLEGEANGQDDVGAFLRRQLNPLLTQFHCAAVVVHHTNKPPKRGESNGTLFGEGAYLGAGSAEWANWSRAVLALRPTTSPGVFELHAGKRGGRLRWVAEDGQTQSHSRLLAHARGDGEIYWRPATEEEMQSTTSKGKTVGTSKEGIALTLLPGMGSVSKRSFITTCAARGIGRDTAHSLIANLIDRGEIQELRVPRPGKRPEVHITRSSGCGKSTADCNSPSQPTSSPPSPPSFLASPARPKYSMPTSKAPHVPESSWRPRNIARDTGDVRSVGAPSPSPSID